MWLCWRCQDVRRGALVAEPLPLEGAPAFQTHLARRCKQTCGQTSFAPCVLSLTSTCRDWRTSFAQGTSLIHHVLIHRATDSSPSPPRHETSQRQQHLHIAAVSLTRSTACQYRVTNVEDSVLGITNGCATPQLQRLQAPRQSLTAPASHSSDESLLRQVASSVAPLLNSSCYSRAPSHRDTGRVPDISHA